MAQKKCENCIAFERSQKTGGYCRIYPPRVIYEVETEAEEGGAATRWPWVKNEDWCMKWSTVDVF